MLACDVYYIRNNKSYVCVYMYIIFGRLNASV